MTSIKIRWISLALFLISCDKDDAPPLQAPEKKTATQLLTQKQWKIARAGFDDNGNGLIDEQENILTECQQGNAYIFNSNGSGQVDDTAPICTPVLASNFTWKLITNDTELEISFEKYSIVRLNEEELMLRAHIPWLTTPFILVHEH